MSWLKEQKERFKEAFEEELTASINDDGDVTISGESFTPTEILFGMDREDIFDSGLVEYIEGRKLEHTDIVISEFPAPIAYFYNQVNSAYDNENHRLHLLRSTWESVIYILYALVLGEVNAVSHNISHVRIFNGQKIKLNKSGLLGDKIGYKLEVIKKIIEDDLANGLKLSVSRYVGVSVLEAMEELNQERNSFSHIAALSPQESQARFDDLEPRLSEILFELDFLRDVSILRFVCTESPITRIKFNRLDGHSLQKRNHHENLTQEQLANYSDILCNSVILMKLNDTFINVSPFVHFEEVTGQLTLCYYKKEDNSENFLFEKVGGSNRDDVSIPKNSMQKSIHNSLGRLL